MRVMAAGCRHITQVGHEIPVAFLTMMLGVGEMKLNRSSRDQITYVMQAPLVDMLSFCALPTDRAGAFFLIADFLDHLGFWQVFDPLIFGVRLILAWTVWFRWLLGRSWRFHSASLLQNPRFFLTFFDSLATVSEIPGFWTNTGPREAGGEGKTETLG